MSFELFVRLFFLLLLAISFLVGRRVVGWVMTYGKDLQAKRRINIGAWAAWLFLNLPSIYFIVRGRSAEGSAHHVWYSFFLYPYFAWLTTSLAMGVVLAAKGLVTLPARIKQWWQRRHGREKEVDLQRRDFLAKGATALPAALLLTSGYGIVRAQADFVWYEPQLKLKNWPRELEGLRIMQISDIHVGHFMQGDKLKRFIADINKRPCDLLMVTGDIVDHNMAWFPECMEAMATLKLPPHGAFVCIGNHDYYSQGAEEILSGMQRLGMTVVRDSNVLVPIGNSGVTVAGIDYPVRAAPGAGRRTFDGHVQTALANCDPEAPVVLLAHHPHAFDEAAAQGVPLTLAGHTHGGQFAFHYGNGKAVSLGDLMFKYVAGEYEQNGSYLYVNRGIGNWFPMRIGAPPEVTLVTCG